MADRSVFVPTTALSTHAEGCLEQFVGKAAKSIAENAEKLFGDKAKGLAVETVATFKRHAIVRLGEHAEAGVFHVKFEMAANGDIVPLKADLLPGKSVSSSEKAKTEARAYVDAFLTGARTAAGEHLKALATNLKEWSTPADPIEAEAAELEDAKEKALALRMWKKIFEEKGSAIRAAVKGPDLESLEAARLTPKFHSLYSGKITEAKDLEVYRSLVTGDVAHLRDRISSLAENIAAVVEYRKGKIPALKESSDPTVAMFEGFTSDYLADLKEIEKAITENYKSVNKVDELGKIYDVLASELHRYEVAGLFVEKMSQRLSEAEEG